MVKGYYKCECGKEFDNPQKFNGHKSRCESHMMSVGKLDKLYQDNENRKNTVTKTCRDKFIQKAEEVQVQWISEQHVCEKCGKVMTEKFGSGRFCSRVCANSHKHSEETKNKISSSIQASIKNDLGYNKVQYEKYNLKPNHCIDCNTTLPYALRLKQRCPDCAKVHTKLLRSTASKNAVKKYGGNINRYGIKGHCKYGTYEDIPCDSSWELAFVYYCIKNNISIKRNHKGFVYTKNDIEHTYYPDFIVNDEIIEIKNYWTPEVQLKIDSVSSEYNYKILYKSDIKKYIDFVVNIEGKNFCEKLYDRSYPSYLDKMSVNK